MWLFAGYASAAITRIISVIRVGLQISGLSRVFSSFSGVLADGRTGTRVYAGARFLISAMASCLARIMALLQRRRAVSGLAY